MAHRGSFATQALELMERKNVEQKSSELNEFKIHIMITSIKMHELLEMLDKIKLSIHNIKIFIKSSFVALTNVMQNSKTMSNFFLRENYHRF